jgi:hypothetical protein
MLKKLVEKLFGKGALSPAGTGFFLDVCCSQCGEHFHLFVNTSTDLMQDFHEDGSVTYVLRKEIIGGGCKNLIQVQMDFDGGKRLLSRKIENGEFIEKTP